MATERPDPQPSAGAPTLCPHLNFAAKVEVNRIEDRHLFVADITVHCTTDCGLPFRLSTEQRPNSFTVDYHGKPWVFTRLPDKQGYGYQCADDQTGPERFGVGAYHWIDTESGTRHKLSFNADGKATVVGSLAHPGMHVVITDGVANDC